MLHFLKFLPAIKDRYEPFQNIALNVKRFSIKFKKILQERRLPAKQFFKLFNF